MQWADTHKFYQSHRVLISNIATSLSANRMTYWNLIEHWLRDSFSGWGKSLQVKVGSVSGANILPDFFHCQNTNPAQTKVKKNCWSTSYYFFKKTFSNMGIVQGTVFPGSLNDTCHREKSLQNKLLLLLIHSSQWSLKDTKEETKKLRTKI